MSDQWRASASPLRKPVLTSSAKSGAYRLGFRRNQERAHLIRRQVGSLLDRHLRATYGVGRDSALCALSRTAVSSTARKTVYAVRIVDSASPRSFKLNLPRLDVGRPELVERSARRSCYR